MTKILINNELVELTSEQETKRLAEVAADKTARDARIAAKTTVTNNKTSGKAKLKSGDALTDAEISALFGD